MMEVYECWFCFGSLRAFTWGRRAQNASSEWNESKAKLVII